MTIKQACNEGNAELFTSDSPAKRAEAKAICASCPVIGPCRQYALDRPQLDGVWGGLTRTERNAMRASTPNQATRWRDPSHA